MRIYAVLAFVVGGLLASEVCALTMTQRAAMVRHARALRGVAYDFGGRLSSGRGVDCQGVVFYALERVSKCGWKSYSVMPQESIGRRELGRPVAGLSPALTFTLRPDKLQPGDIVYILGAAENDNEKALTDAPRLWVWHMGMATEDGRWIHADPYSGKVNEEPLLDFLVHHADVYSGVYVTRLDRRPRPKRCRRHPRMPAPRARR